MSFTSTAVGAEGLWARVHINVALAIIKVDGHWATYAVITPEVRASAEKIVGGGYQTTATATELAEMVVDEVITVAEYESITGLVYGGVDPGEEEPVEEPEDPGDVVVDPGDPGGGSSSTLGGALPITLA